MLSSGSGGQGGDEHIVDRIANRLADIMTVRTGTVGMDGLVPPPVYESQGGAGPSSGAPGYDGGGYGPGQYPAEKGGHANMASPTPPAGALRPLPRSPSPPATRPMSDMSETGLGYAQGASGTFGQGQHPYAQAQPQPGQTYGGHGEYGRPRPPPPV